MYSKLILVPQKLDLEQLVQDYPVDFDFNFDYAYAFIHQILINTSYRIEKQTNWEKFKNSKPIIQYYLMRDSKVLQPQFRDYKLHLDYLYRHDIIWRTRYDDKNCRKYQLAPRFFAEKVRFIMITDCKVIKIFFKEKPENEGFHPLNKWFDIKLRIDTESALEYLNSKFEGNLNWRYYLMRNRAVLEIANNHYYFSRKKYTDDRLHSSFTGIPRDVRQYLRYDGKELGEVDISASVPFFLYCQLLYLIDDGERINRDSFDKFFKDRRLYESALRITKDKVKLDTEEVLRFGKSLKDGAFYKDIMEHFDEQYYVEHGEYVLNRPYNDTAEDRKLIAKKMILSSINSKRKQHLDTKEIMKITFPTIMEFLDIFKTRRYLNQRDKNWMQKKMNLTELEAKKKFKQHKKIPHLLLQSESYFMLDVVARKLNKRYSTIPFFTLHDCIVTTVENVCFLENFMEQTFKESIGFSPDFKPKNYAMAG